MHIACHRSHLEERCQERGYTLEQVMGCVVSQDGDVWTIDPDHKSYPRTKPGLGDRVEGVLKSVGITQGASLQTDWKAVRVRGPEKTAE